MSAVHLHLLLSHVPVIGIFGVALLLLIAYIRRSDELARVALGVAVLVAIAAGIVFLTGEGAEHAVENLAGISEAAVESHEDAAAVALWLTIAFGVLALGALVMFRRRSVARGAGAVFLLLALVVAGVLAWTANLGGVVRHSEITGSPTAVPTAENERD